ncbi:glutathione S-transferase C-terminal domain-containing protein [Actinoplanes derwentensis]|uniref:glutathione S-transferase C-terminal domain-containing protein n=1 Tax=Actinoplanes derwentensis TaxID=113562 RepID=UPI0012FD10FF|nr:glutathione S-transferase C-terminal domain-containing protein [Actinoplanes derwentensis]
MLRQVYEATEEGFDGHVAVPARWGRLSSRVVSTDATGIAIGLATRFRHLTTDAVDTYPPDLRTEIERLDEWIGPAVNINVSQARTDPTARAALLEAFALLDNRLAHTDFLIGGALTEADIRLWVTLVRFDVTVDFDRTLSAGLHTYPNLWRYARRLYRRPAFADTTRFASFTTPGATIPPWN